jgi:hypothetical protein
MCGHGRLQALHDSNRPLGEVGRGPEASRTTPVDLQAKLAGDTRSPVEDASQFWSIAGAL